MEWFQFPSLASRKEAVGTKPMHLRPRAKVALRAPKAPPKIEPERIEADHADLLAIGISLWTLTHQTPHARGFGRCQLRWEGVLRASNRALNLFWRAHYDR